MTTDFKKAFFGFGLGLVLFYVGLQAFSKKEETMPVQQPITKDNVQTALRAYENALADNASPSKLAELNDELAKQFGVRIKQGSGTELIVNDLSGNKVSV